MADPPPILHELVAPDAPGSWAGAGFEVDGEECRVSSVTLRLAGEEAGSGLTGWVLGGLLSYELDGLPTRSDERPRALCPGRHPNGVTSIDHVVVASPDLDRTVPALEAAGLTLRRAAGLGVPLALITPRPRPQEDGA